LFPSFGNSATNIGQETIHFQNYSNTTTNKSMLFRGNQTGGAVTLQACLYRSTSAISSFTLSGVGGNIGSGSTFNLYGIQAGNA
jgi:hypothetical protein